MSQIESDAKRLIGSEYDEEFFAYLAQFQNKIECSEIIMLGYMAMTDGVPMTYADAIILIENDNWFASMKGRTYLMDFTNLDYSVRCPLDNQNKMCKQDVV